MHSRDIANRRSRWGSIFQGASTKPTLFGKLRHVAYAGGWKKFEPIWDWVIRAKRVTNLLPVLESVLAGFGKYLEAKAEKGNSLSPSQVIPSTSAALIQEHPVEQ